METVALIGVGLISGSFALALRRAGFRGRILGASSPHAVAEGLAAGAIDEALPAAEAAARADLVMLARPISRIIADLADLSPHFRSGAFVTDVGSTKSRICAAAAAQSLRATFIGGHPMAGKESRGASAADPALFEQRTWFLTPLDTGHLDLDLARDFVGWLERIGARVVPIAPADHDRLVAFTSHVPQLASTALAAALHDFLPDERVRLGAGPGLHDMTRLALSTYDIWADIVATNTPAIRAALADYIGVLDELRAALARNDLESYFVRARGLAEAIRRRPADPDNGL